MKALLSAMEPCADCRHEFWRRALVACSGCGRLICLACIATHKHVVVNPEDA